MKRWHHHELAAHRKHLSCMRKCSIPSAVHLLCYVACQTIELSNAARQQQTIFSMYYQKELPAQTHAQ